MSGFTNRFKMEILKYFLRSGRTFHVALVTDTRIPGPDTNKLSDLEEIVSGNGYDAGGMVVSGDANGFPEILEDDDNNKAIAKIKDFSLKANGGSIPASGDGASYAVLTSDGSSVGDRWVYLWFELEDDSGVLQEAKVSNGQEIKVNGMRADLLGDSS